ncbi:hypothetical protein [Paenibacillus caui]|uniref:hypothetical protein n=1 Tax=Paenibacillus caui TaxID=2873927 RepID=UPI001CA84309|nr:hypothetical protein [Paenibacillus caui]
MKNTKQFLLMELLVRAVITAHTGLENRRIRFVCNRYGKPSLKAAIPLDSFTLHPAESEGEWYSPEAAGYRFSSGKIDERHYLSACVNGAWLPQTVRSVNCETVFSFFTSDALPRSLYAKM